MCKVSSRTSTRLSYASLKTVVLLSQISLSGLVHTCYYLVQVRITVERASHRRKILIQICGLI